MEAQELMRFHQDGGLALIVMKGHKPWIMYDGAELKLILTRHIFGTGQKSSLGVEDFSGAQILPFYGHPDFANPPDVGGHTDFAIVLTDEWHPCFALIQIECWPDFAKT